VKHARQRGIALLVAIIMFAIATTVAAAITYNKAMAARRAAATFTLEQALQAGMAAEALAAIVLENSATAQRTQTNQDWAHPVGPLEIEGTGVWIQAQLEDLQGRFNINSLLAWDATANDFTVDVDQLTIFKRLLDDQKIDQRYADLLADWIDPDITPTSQGGEDTLYLSQTPPYRPPNTFIVHTSEMLALPGLGAENFAKIAPYITALPNDEKVNVCTASGIVLDAVRNDPATQVEYANADLPSYREKNCWPLLQQDYIAGTSPGARAKAEARVTEKSTWFRLRTHIRVGTAEFVLYSVLLLENNKARTIRRSFGSE
jgi:general secretion pathway protein K